MNAATCQALVSLFPLVMITLVLERRSTAIKIRKRQWFRDIAIGVLVASLLGLTLAILGCAMDGLSDTLAFLAWACTILSGLGLGWTLLASMASMEVDEDEAKDAQRLQYRRRPRMRASKPRR